MSIIYKVLARPENPWVKDSPKRYFPQIVNLGKSVNLKFVSEKVHLRSSLPVGDIKGCLQNFVDELKSQLLEGKSVNIEGLGVFSLSAKSKGEEKSGDVSASSVDSLRICFMASRELKLYKSATRADEKVDLISLDEYLKKLTLIDIPKDPDSGSGSENKPGEGGEEENPL